MRGVTLYTVPCRSLMLWPVNSLPDSIADRRRSMTFRSTLNGSPWAAKTLALSTQTISSQAVAGMARLVPKKS